MSEFVRLKVKRRGTPQESPYWEEFRVARRPNLNVISVLMEIQRNPVNAKGEATTAVVWECNCLEEVCGACTMIINGAVRQACTALIDKLEQPIVLEPMTSFPVIKDLMVDRSVMFDNLKKVKAWIPIDGTYDLGPGPRMPENIRRWAYDLSRCMTCGACAEACPNFNSRSPFMGPASIVQVRLFNAHPTGKMNKEERLDALTKEGGIAGCGNAQNCVKVCPKGIRLTDSIAELNREVNRFAIRRWLKR